MDRFNNLFVTAYVTPGNARFLLLHDGKNDDSIRSFFTEVHDLYLRVSRTDTRFNAWWVEGAATCSLSFSRLEAGDCCFRFAVYRGALPNLQQELVWQLMCAMGTNATTGWRAG